MKSFNYVFILACLFASMNLFAQNGKIEGRVTFEGSPVSSIKVELKNTEFSTFTDEKGEFEFNGLSAGKYRLLVSDDNFESGEKTLSLGKNKTIKLEVKLKEVASKGKEGEVSLGDVVVSGTMKPVSKDRSPVPVEVYSQSFFKKNPTPSMFEALQTVNGVRPQVNCNVCNTGDIHINGLEGPYTMVLIDGMPIVSSLGTVYGLSGIPSSMIERIEVVKGPASSLYGSEAVGGLINVITKKAYNADKFSADVMATSWQEYNADLGYKFNIGRNVDVLTGVNYFNFQKIYDKNNDNFTDVTLQHRISAFQKWNINRPENRLFSVAARYLYEDRWGGDVTWEKKYRGGSEKYGESIYTSRAELIGVYQLPISEKMFINFSLINHDQDSRYGADSYIANQKIGFGQLTWDKKVGRHDLLAGVALRYTYYDDNTPGTQDEKGKNNPEKTWLPGIFVQDEISLAPKHNLLLGARYDHNNYHGSIFTPRLAYKWTITSDDIFRFNAGTGFRVVNLFTEDHAALTGAREVVIKNSLKPEESYNANLNYVKRFYLGDGALLSLDASAYYTYFNNKIKGDFETNDQQIIYDNLDGHAVYKGIGLNADLKLANGFNFMVGGTYMDNKIYNKDEKTGELVGERPEFSENFSGIWSVSYKIRPLNLTLDYTGNLYGPMKLPLAGDNDPRKPESPWYSIQNIQLSYLGLKSFEIYGGVKNLLNWTPADNIPFLIARPHDPFDKKVVFDANDVAQVTPENPYGLTFSPEYVYAANQGIRGFLGIRYKF